MKRMYLVILVAISIGSQQVFGDAGATFNKLYDDKVCANEPTCNLTLTPDLDQKRLTLDGRDCMCDFECAEYNDCCRDSQYFNAAALSSPRKTYACLPLHKVYALIGCPASYKDQTVRRKCDKALQPLDENDSVIITPVTNKNKRVTYANGYCALCNGDTDFEPWNLTAGCGEPTGEAPKIRVNFNKYKSKLPAIMPLVRYDAAKKQFWAKYEGKDLLCEFSTKQPTEMEGYVRRCLPDMVAECAADADGGTKCSSHIAVVYDTTVKKPYRNRECALCNGAPADKLSGCAVGVRTGASSLFSAGSKTAGSDACSNPEIAKKFC